MQNSWNPIIRGKNRNEGKLNRNFTKEAVQMANKNLKKIVKQYQLLGKYKLKL